MRVVILCVAAFAGGLLAGALVWPDAFPERSRASRRGPEEASPEPGTAPRAGGAPATTVGGSAQDAEAVRAQVAAGTRLRDVAGEAANEVARILSTEPALSTMTGDGKVTGTVRDAAGAPVAGAIVTINPEAQPSGLTIAARRSRERPHLDRGLEEVAREAIESELWRRAARRTAVTGPDGRYELQGLADLPHNLTAYHERYELKPTSQANRIRPDAVVDFVAQPVAEVRVEVRRPDGTLPDYAWVSWNGPAGRGWDYWTPDPGRLRLPVGSCRVKAQVWVPEPMVSDEIEATVALEPSGEPLVIELASRRVLTARLALPEGYLLPDSVEFRLRRLTGSDDPDPASLDEDQFKRNASTRLAGQCAWTDLEPGRYQVAAFLQKRRLLGSVEAELADAPLEVEIPVEEPAGARQLVVVLLGPEGGPVSGNAWFQTVAGPRRRTAEALRRTDGSWLVMLADETEEDAGVPATLRISTADYGVAEEPIDLARPGTLTVRFREAAQLRVRVDRYEGSPVEGRLHAALVSDSGIGAIASRPVVADATCDFARQQPGAYGLVLYVSDGDQRWPILRDRVTLRAGEQAVSVGVPVLHTLRVRLAGRLRAGAALLTADDPAFGALRRRVRFDEERVAVFADLAAGTYEVEAGNRKLQVRVPGPEEVVLE